MVAERDQGLSRLVRQGRPLRALLRLFLAALGAVRRRRCRHRRGLSGIRGAATVHLQAASRMRAPPASAEWVLRTPCLRKLRLVSSMADEGPTRNLCLLPTRLLRRYPRCHRPRRGPLR